MSKKLLWAIRYDAEDWLIKKKWNDFYALEEVVGTPPLKKWGISGEEAWQIAARDTKRYEVEATQGDKVIKAKYDAEAGKGKGKEKGKSNDGTWIGNTP